MNAITTVQSSNLTLRPASPQAARMMAVWTNRLADGGKNPSFIDGEQPTPEQRQWLEIRAGRIEKHLAPMADGELAGLLASMSLVLRDRNMDSLTSSTIADIYRAVLADVPSVALISAGNAYVRGEVDASGFMPKPGQLRKEALRRVPVEEGEWFQIRKVLAAPVVPKIDHSEASKTRVAAMAADIVRGARMVTERDRKQRKLRPLEPFETPSEILAKLARDCGVAPDAINTIGERRA